ncbi:proprotein convertase P-domain-containing protein, partial [Lacinutrix iliipiscaria]
MKKFTLLLFVLLAVSWQSYAQDHSTVALAQPLVIDSNCVGTSGGANSGDPTGFDNTDGNVCSASYSGGDDYIFSYVGNGSALQLDLTTSNTWSGMMVTEGTPTGGTCVGSANSSTSSKSLLTIGLTAGVTYYIHISTYPTPQSPGQFCLNAAEVAPATPPANNFCIDAEVISVNTDESCSVVTSGTINLASDSGEDSTTCSGTEDDDVWYSFVASSSTHTIDLLNVSGSTTDLFHSVWEGACGALTNLSCSDPNSSIASGLTPGNTYLLRVYSWTSTAGQDTTFDVCIGTPPAPPANNTIDGAEVLTVNADLNCTDTTSGTIENATASGENTTACGGTEDDDVWYSFVALGETQNISLLNVAGSTTDLYHSVWEGTSGSLTNLSCSDPNSSTITGLTIGNTYLLRVYSWTSTSGQDTTFDVCITTEPAFVDVCGGAFTSTPGATVTNGSPVIDNLTVALSPTDIISDLDVAINLPHTFTGDVDITLTSPNGTVVELTTDNGGGGDNYENTVFDDDAATSIVGATAPFTGTFSPEGNLSDFNGEIFDGTWTLTVEDDAGGDDGTLISWCLFPTVITPPDCAITDIAAGAQAPCSYDGVTSTYSQDIVVTYNDAPATGSLDVNGQLFPITGSPQTVTLTGLLADELDVDVNAVFTDLLLCSYAETAVFTAPGECIPPIDCSTSEVRNTTFCYGNSDDTTSWSYSSSDGGPLLVSFNAGQMESCCDDIEIYDGTDDSGIELFNAGLTDMTGVTVIANSGSVFMRMDSDSSVSCEANGYVPLDWDVSCFVAPACTITDVTAGTQSPCDETTITYSQDIIITYNDAPASGTLDVNGQSFTIETSPQTVTLTDLPADSQIVDVNVSFSQEAFCTFEALALFQAPEDCTPVPTDDCGAYTSTDQYAIDDANDPVSTIVVTGTGGNVIDDLNVAIAIDHTYIGDLDITLTSPEGTVVDLFFDQCFGDDNLNIILDDQGTPVDCTGTGPLIGVFQPTGNLSDFLYDVFDGTWTLSIVDDAGGDDGTLLSWCLLPTLVPPPACPNPVSTEGAATCLGGGTALLEAFTTCEAGDTSGNVSVTDAGGESGHGTGFGTGGDSYADNEAYRMDMDVTLPPGAVVQNTTVYVEYTSTFPTEFRIQVTPPSGAVQTDLAPGSSGNFIGDFNNIDYPSVDGTWTFRFMDTYNDGGTTVDATVTNMTIVVDYIVSGGTPEIQWYADDVGGTILATGDTFDPVPFLPNGDTNTPGVYTFYAACSTQNECRTATEFEILELPEIVVPDNIVACGPVELEELDEGGYFTEPDGDGEEYEGGDIIEESVVLYVFAESFTTPNCTAQGSFSIIIGDTYPTTTGAEICAGDASQTVSASAACGIGLQETSISYSGSGGTSGLNPTTGTGTDTYADNTPINITVPALPAGAVATGTSVQISFETNGGSYQSELRVEATPPSGAVQTDLAPGTGLGGTTLDADLGSWGSDSPVGDWTFRFKESYNDGGTTVDANITDITITVTYLVEDVGVINWYTNATGGSSIASGNTFDPIAFLPSGNTDTPGIYTLYAACSTAPACRTAVDFTIHPQTVAIAPEDVLTCDSYNLPAIIADGAYYTGPNGTGDALAVGAAITETTTVYVFADNGNCTAEDSFVVTIDNDLPRIETVSVCAGDTQAFEVSTVCPETMPSASATGSGGESGLNPGGTASDTYADNTPINITFPTLPTGAIITNTEVMISYTTLGGSWRSEMRVEATPPSGAVQTDLQPSTLTSGGTITDANIGSWGADDPSGDWTFRFRETYNDGTSSADANITNITITVSYDIPGNILWYATETSTEVIGTGSSFDPAAYLPGGNTNTIGSYTFYAECVALPGCRNPAVYEIYGPTISCPEDIEVDTDLGECGAVVEFTIDADANCPNSVITQTEGLPSGTMFPVGTTTNTFVVTDAGGNTATCSFDVTVDDNEAPNVNCAAITVVLDGNGEVNVTASQLDDNSSDNCGIASYTIDGNSSADFTCADTGGDLSDLIISQYIDGPDANDCIEIYNGTGNTVELTGNYSISIYFNGITTPQVWPLLGSIANDDTYVICQQFSDAEATGNVDLINGIMWNGNDAVSLDNNGNAIDILGIIGNNPGLDWNAGGNSTKNT